MTVTVAIDSFKGSLSTFETAKAVSEGIKEVFPNSKVLTSPLADGGEGTVDAVVTAMGGRLISATVQDPLGRKIQAEYGITPDGTLAVIEMARAAGITLLSEEEKNPLYTTTFGVGELILHAIRVSGCRKFLIGIGGSATNDGGIGMLSALGFEFLDEEGLPVPYGAIGLSKIKKIVTKNAASELSECEFSIACDVKNPLCGEFGASAIYGPQKGADEKMIKDMDGWLMSYAELSRSVIGNADESYPGAGAAGGLGFAFLTYLSGKLQSGIELVMSATGLEEKIKESQLVITGEGRLDGQSAMGKAPVGVAKLAKKYGLPVIAFSGAVTEDAEQCHDMGIDAYFPILDSPVSLSEAMDPERAYKNLKRTARQVFRVVELNKR